jgi:hypothetical protein
VSVMEKCVYCGNGTQLYVNGQPVCLRCVGPSEAKKPRVSQHEQSASVEGDGRDIEAALRILEAIAETQRPSQADVLTLRLWSGPHKPMRPIKDIAIELLQEAGHPLEALYKKLGAEMRLKRKPPDSERVTGTSQFHSHPGSK